MKKGFIVGVLTSLAVMLLFFVSLVGDNIRRLNGMSADSLSGEATVERFAMAPMADAEEAPSAVGAAAPARSRGKMEKKSMKAFGSKGQGVGGGGLGYDSAIAPMELAKEAPSAEPPPPPGGASEVPGAPTRAWFPETFLFEPLIVTNEQGQASVPVKVPDRLTTWRVLALAHSREGGQSGALATFLGTLPTYVEPVVPGALFAGDSVRLPVQVVNTTDAALSAALRLSATNATLSSAGGPVTVPAGGSALQYVTLTTTRPGDVSLTATLGTTDAIERRIEVKPAGKRETVSRGGTLALPRSFELTGPAGALPGTESVRVHVFPGALGVVKSELSASPGRGGVADDGYLLMLLGRAPKLLTSLGADSKPEVIRELTLLATQRVMRHARAPSVPTAALLTEAALAHPDNAVLSRLGERLAGQVAAAQRPDGTCQGATGWTLQRLLVMTADCVRAVGTSTATPQAAQRATAVRLKASGAFERNAARITDAYTAAAVLASGAVQGTVAEQLKALVVGSLKEGVDGARYLPVEQGVVRADGRVPSSVEATALAVLALEGDATAPLADLGTFLLGSYNPWGGFGDGYANQVALRAVTQLFKDPVPAQVTLVLERDGVELTRGDFKAEALRQVVVLNAPAEGSSGTHAWRLRAEPPVPGLGYSFSLVAYTPWREEAGQGGLLLTTALPPTLEVGRTTEVVLTASLPARLEASLKLGLPAGVLPDTAALDALVSAGTIQRYETEDGLVTLTVPAQAPGATFTTKVRVTPTLGGTLQAPPSSLEPIDRPQLARAFAPLTWRVR